MRCVNEESVINAMERHKDRAIRKQKIEKQQQPKAKGGSE
jgi:hypothetical protein